MAKKATKKEKVIEEPVVEQIICSVKCIQLFYDLEAEKSRQFGEMWEVDKARADKLKSMGLVQVL